MVWALPTMADTGTIEMPQNVNSVVMHIMCTNFGAFITKWRIGLVCRCHFTILQLLKKWHPFCTKGCGFYHENFSKQYSGAIFRRNTCFEWHYSTAFIIGWRPFWTPPIIANTGTISRASISENVYSIVMYICTNFGAFIKKWTIGLVYLTMPLHYAACTESCTMIAMNFIPECLRITLNKSK